MLTMVNRKENLIYKPVDFDPFEGGEIIRTAPATEPQKEIWTSCMLGGQDASRGYNESVSLRLKGNLSVVLLKNTLKKLVQRHEALRSAFSGDGSTILIFDSVAGKLDYTDLSGIPAAQQQEILQNYILDDALHLFDLLNGPLFKVGLHKLADQEYHFTFTGHHIVCDGWSLGIILQDISKIYSALAQHIEPVLAPATLLTDFAFQQLEFAESNEREEITRFWLDQYQQKVPVLDLPTTFTRPAVRTFKSKRIDFKIDQELIHQLKETGKLKDAV